MGGMLAPRKAAVMDEAAAARRAALREQGKPAAILNGEGERGLRSLEKERGDVGAAALDDLGRSAQNRFAISARGDLGRRARNAEAGRHLRADRDKTTLRLPAPNRRMGKVARRAVVADRVAEEAGTDKDALHAQATPAGFGFCG